MACMCLLWPRSKPQPASGRRMWSAQSALQPEIRAPKPRHSKRTHVDSVSPVAGSKRLASGYTNHVSEEPPIGALHEVWFYQSYHVELTPSSLVGGFLIAIERCSVIRAIKCTPHTYELNDRIDYPTVIVAAKGACNVLPFMQP